MHSFLVSRSIKVCIVKPSKSHSSYWQNCLSTLYSTSMHIIKLDLERMMITNLFFSRLIQICGELFFQNGFSTLVSFYEDISKWYIHHLPFHSSRPFPKVGDQLSLHACNHVCFVWQTPTIRFFLWQFHKISQPSKSSNSIKKNGRKTIPNSIPIHGLSLRLWESPMNLDLNINALTLSRL